MEKAEATVCYIYILQDRTCSEVYDIGDKYINGYITTSIYDLPGYGTYRIHLSYNLENKLLLPATLNEVHIKLKQLISIPGIPYY